MNTKKGAGFAYYTVWALDCPAIIISKPTPNHIINLLRLTISKAWAFNAHYPIARIVQIQTVDNIAKRLRLI